MFEDYTLDYFLKQAREQGEAYGVDTREGSVYMDACTGHCIRTAKFYSDLSNFYEMNSIDTATGTLLDEKAKERNLARKAATPAVYNVTFVGVAAADLLGDRFMAGGYYFTLVKISDGYYLQCETTGAATNSVASGTAAVPVRNTMGLTSATIGMIYEEGTDEETDDSLRERLKDVVSNTAENGNKKHYKSWCESIDGIGRAIIYPLALGDNTVKAVLISSAGTAPTSALVDKVQEYVDPNHEGLGEGAANIGAHFYAYAAVETQLSFTLTAVLASGYTAEQVKANATTVLTAYLKKIALESSDDTQMVIHYVQIVSILTGVDGISDFRDLEINGGSANITIGTDNVGVLGEVTVNVGT